MRHLALCVVGLFVAAAAEHNFSDPHADHFSEGVAFDRAGDMDSAIYAFQSAVRFSPSIRHYMALVVAYNRCAVSNSFQMGPNYWFGKAKQVLEHADRTFGWDPDIQENRDLVASNIPRMIVGGDYDSIAASTDAMPGDTQPGPAPPAPAPPTPTFEAATPPTPTPPKPAIDPDVCAVGDAITAVWQDGKLYPGRIAEIIPPLTIVIDWEDGDNRHRIVRAEDVFRYFQPCAEEASASESPPVEEPPARAPKEDIELYEGEYITAQMEAEEAQNGWDFDDPMADHGSKALEYDAQNDLGNVIRAFKSACKFNPDDSLSFRRLGVAYMRAGNVNFDGLGPSTWYGRSKQALEHAQMLGPYDMAVQNSYQLLSQNCKIQLQHSVTELPAATDGLPLTATSARISVGANGDQQPAARLSH